MVNACGVGRVRDAWAAAAASEQATAAVGLAEVIAPDIRHIGWITNGRTAINRFGGRVVLPLKDTVPAAAIVYYIAVATAVVFVFAQVWDGLAGLGGTLTPRLP